MDEQTVSPESRISPSLVCLLGCLVEASGSTSVGRRVEKVNDSFSFMKLRVVSMASSGFARHPVTKNIMTRSTALSCVSVMGDTLSLWTPFA